ncbi:MAG TPA: T9SS type A sorting domain-containing protein, partial [Ignavibacteriaceae bacterium]|nr:T9SS type A sorting domain-containing protein [Ignavibacteriaceae bacterium]
GILIGTKGMNGTDVLKFRDGDSITLTGKIVENYSVTAIDSLTTIVINSHDNPVPAPVTVPTADIGKNPSNTISAEQWESVLIDYKNVTVVRENADGNPGPGVSGVNNNYGEMFVKDTLGGDSTRISLQDGNNNYENHWDPSFIDNQAYNYINTGSKFSDLIGIVYYSFSNYKMCPRKSDDFVGFVPTAVKEYTNKMPGTFGLSQNYPNPFNPSTVITFSIPKESQVTLKIFNILGQEVKTLVNDSRMPGKYTVNFNASSLSSGVYFYALRAGNYFQVKKMMLLK